MRAAAANTGRRSSREARHSWLINRVGADADGQAQVGREGGAYRFVRLFALASHADKQVAESKVTALMADATGDTVWVAEDRRFKTLTLEHHMAATRFGFDAMFEPLYRAKRLHQPSRRLLGTASLLWQADSAQR